MQSVANGHEVIALANLRPPLQGMKDELDSYMYQTVGHDVIHLYKDCLGVPLYRREINGQPIEQGSDYVVTAADETEDLYELLKEVKEAHPDLQGVSVGAILSSYQRIRVENVCGRLGLVTLAYLWQRNQEELLNEMAQAGVNAILVKIAAIGLKRHHLGRTIGDMYPYFCQMNREYDLHICGEGGEYETITLDCPLFKRKIVVDESEVVIHADDQFAQVAYLRFKKLHLEDKTDDEMDLDWKTNLNRSPVWDADEMMASIERIVSSNQKVIGIEHGSADTSMPTIADPAHSSYQSKFATHQSSVFCAIGGTTAYDQPPSEGKTMSISEETTACLQNVQAKLERIRLSWAEVVFMQVFVADMKDFGIVNGAYKEFFGINPPPRACVGAHLPGPTRIQVSCLAIRKDFTTPRPRTTLHVQGMSYWAPANIGPYSQATEQAYHCFIAGQIGMIPSTLNLPEPSSLAKETAWSLRNLCQIATLRETDVTNRAALCIAYVNSPKHFVPVTAAWEHIANKETPAPVLVISMPSLPKGAQVEWQVILHHGRVYANKEQPTAAVDSSDGYETDDDNMYELEKRALRPTSLTHLDEQHISAPVIAGIDALDQSQVPGSDQASSGLHWKTRTQSWFLAPLLMALSVVQVSEASFLSPVLSSLSISSERIAGRKDGNSPFTRDNVREMLAGMIRSMHRILESHKSPVTGPGVEGGWGDVVGVTLYYQETVDRQRQWLTPMLDELLFEFTAPSSNIAVALVPVQAIAEHGVFAMTIQAVGKMPTIPGILQL